MVRQVALTSAAPQTDVDTAYSAQLRNLAKLLSPSRFLAGSPIVSPRWRARWPCVWWNTRLMRFRARISRTQRHSETAGTRQGQFAAILSQASRSDLCTFCRRSSSRISSGDRRRAHHLKQNQAPALFYILGKETEACRFHDPRLPRREAMIMARLAQRRAEGRDPSDLST